MTQPAEQKQSSAFLNSTEAQLFVSNIQASCDFYTRNLGFTVAFTYGNPPFYGQVTRGRAKLNLRVVGEPVFAGDIREREHLLSATITIGAASDLEELFESFQTAEVPLHQTLKTEPWGARTFVVSDPDGNFILFAAEAD